MKFVFICFSRFLQAVVSEDCFLHVCQLNWDDSFLDSEMCTAFKTKILPYQTEHLFCILQTQEVFHTLVSICWAVIKNKRKPYVLKNFACTCVQTIRINIQDDAVFCQAPNLLLKDMRSVYINVSIIISFRILLPLIPSSHSMHGYAWVY